MHRDRILPRTPRMGSEPDMTRDRVLDHLFSGDDQRHNVGPISGYRNSPPHGGSRGNRSLETAGSRRKLTPVRPSSLRDLTKGAIHPKSSPAPFSPMTSAD